MKTNIDTKNKKRLGADLSRGLIAALGGTSQVARICLRTPSTVSEWKNEGMPRAWVMYLREKYAESPAIKHPEVQDF